MVELYTSEGYSSCPPADKWLSTATSPVKAGENSGDALLDDYVVRQYTPVGDYSAATAAKAEFARRSGYTGARAAG